MPIARVLIFARFRQEGFHAWPDAPEARAYLRHRHRHLFHVEVEMPAVADDKRTVEFHDLIVQSRMVMRDVAKRGTMYDYSDWSCELIALAMAERLSAFYARQVNVTISEDGECGARVVAY